MAIYNVKVSQRKVINSIQDLALSITNIENAGSDETILKSIDGRVVLIQNGEIIYELTDDYSMNYYNDTDRQFRYIFSCEGKPRWKFDL